MNCRPGDLALTLRDGTWIPAGCIVKCIEFHPFAVHALTGAVYDRVWLIEWNGAQKHEDGIPYGAPDSWLRPLRDNPGEDETLSWAGLPKKVGEVA